MWFRYCSLAFFGAGINALTTNSAEKAPDTTWQALSMPQWLLKMNNLRSRQPSQCCEISIPSFVYSNTKHFQT